MYVREKTEKDKEERNEQREKKKGRQSNGRNKISLIRKEIRNVLTMTIYLNINPFPEYSSG